LIACGYYFSGQFRESRETLSRLLLNDPSNHRAAAMLEIVKSKVWQGKLLGSGFLL
jgi:Fis1 C-terminal tetratricopeptide repeat